MGYNDQELRFSNAQEVTTGSGAGVASTNILDFNESRNMGVGSPLFIVVLVTTAMTDAGSDSAMDPVLQADDDVAFGSVDNTQNLGTFAALALAGARLSPIIQHDVLDSRYGRILYTSTNGDLTTGNFTAFITIDVDAWTAYPVGYEIVGP